MIIRIIFHFLFRKYVFYDGPKMIPHSGQSSQLSVEANDGNAQFLPKFSGAVVFAHEAQEGADVNADNSKSMSME